MPNGPKRKNRRSAFVPEDGQAEDAFGGPYLVRTTLLAPELSASCPCNWQALSAVQHAPLAPAPVFWPLLRLSGQSSIFLLIGAQFD